MDVSGEHVWCNPPFQLDTVKAFVQHFLACKARAPGTTGGAFLIPTWAGFPEVFRACPEFRLLKEYPPHAVLFSKPMPDGSRCTLPGPSWAVQIWYAAPDQAGSISAIRTGHDGPMCFEANAAGRNAKVMVDSGACTKPPGTEGAGHDGYVSALWALRNGFTPEAAAITQVTVANDQSARIEGSITVHVTIGTYGDTLRLLVMEHQMEGIDMLLGTEWLARRGVIQDFHEDVVRLSKGGKQHLLVPERSNRANTAVAAICAMLRAQPEHQAIKTISASRAQKDLRRGARAMLLRAYFTYVEEPAVGAVAADPDGSTKREDMPAPVRKLVVEFEDVFKEMSELPPEREVAHSIPLVDNAKAPSKRMYRLSPREKEEVIKQVTKLLEMGLIQPSSSPFGAPVLFVDKPDGSLRMCLDYRALNDITVKRRYPMPNISDLFDQLHGAKVFSSLDLQQGYYQIRIPEGDIPKTAFMTHLGQYEFRVLCMGLTNAPATFQEAMNKVFAPHLGKFVLVYLDDIMVYSKSVEEHAVHLRQVLELLRQHKFLAKLSKCDFCRKEVKFLGHIVSEEGLRVDPKKVSAVQDWPVPLGVPQLRSFLGLANYFRKFIQAYSTIVTPLTSLTASKVPWEWDAKCQKAFEEVKTALTKAPVLALPDPSKPYTIIADASIHGTGGILLQGDRVVAYLSHKFDTAQRNYHTTDQECLGIIHALQEWRCYVEGIDVTLITDHQPLTYLQSLSSKGPLSRRHARWMEILSRFHFTWQYRKGTLNAADSLSRVHGPLGGHLPHVSALCASLVTTDLRAVMAEAYASDPKFKDSNVTDKWTLDPGSGLWLNKNLQVVVPASKVDTVIKELHDSALGAHQGVNRTHKALRGRFWWPSMYADVARYIAHCPKCQVNKASNAKKAGLLQPLPIPEYCWQSVSMDFVTGLPVSAAGHDAIFVIVDRFSKMCHFVPTTTTCSAEEAMRLFTDNVIRLHGVPRDIVADRDTRWTGHFWAAMAERLGTQLKLSTAYHPETDGQTERMNRVLEEALRSAVSGCEHDWDNHLSLIEFAINNAVADSTKTTPFLMNYLRAPRLPIDIDVPQSVPAAVKVTEEMHERIEAARRCLRLAQARQVSYANAKRRDLELEEGQEVLLNTEHLRRAMPGKPKLQPRYVGPFTILKRVGKVAYRLELPPSYRIHPVFHVSLLKAYTAQKDKPLPPTPVEPVAVPDAGPGPAFSIGGKAWFTVQDIVGHKDEPSKVKMKGKRKFTTRMIRHYLVRWQGYSTSDDTFRPARELCHDKLVEDLIKAYCERNGVQFKKA
jgi:hypothetical protein